MVGTIAGDDPVGTIGGSLNRPAALANDDGVVACVATGTAWICQGAGLDGAEIGRSTRPNSGLGTVLPQIKALGRAEASDGTEDSASKDSPRIALLSPDKKLTDRTPIWRAVCPRIFMVWRSIRWRISSWRSDCPRDYQP